MRKSIIVLILAVLTAAPLANAVTQAIPAKAKVDPNNAKVDALFAQWDKTDSPGLALAVIKDGKTIYQRGYGMANLEYGLSITTATVFVIASLSKQFTVFCILLLLQGGKLKLDDDIRKYLPEVADFGKTITIRYLIHHTSGLRENLALASHAGWRSGDIITERDMLGLISKQKELNFEPGSQYLYCNTGYMLLSVIVRRASGKSLRDYAQENVFEPLGMKQTQFRDNHLMIIPNLAASYSPKNPGGWQYSLNHGGINGAGNLHTTLDDLARWDGNFYEARVGGKKVIDQMHEKFTLNDGKVIDYAGGLNVGAYRGLKTVSHEGAIAGYRTTLLRFPDQKFSVVILANAANVATAPLARKVADIYLVKELMEEKAQQKVEDKKTKPAKQEQPKLEQAQLKEYAGSFYSEELEVIYQVLSRDGKLWLRHRKDEFPLRATAADEFSGTFGEYVGGVTVRFARSDQKHVNGFTIDSGRIKNLKFVRAEIKLQQ